MLATVERVPFVAGPVASTGDEQSRLREKVSELQRALHLTADL